ncbi:glycosyltransferase family 2 protein [Ruegeria sp. R13_0]|uniref:glycosyltransferase family 2 protein n=1 Tax=Ruegeria sp. R13_0 TaxID=2821099 RepID=UPI001ADC8285|nr:glycosyltransferase family 2 protein [Ruegeria sp. R13_0]MBO9434455.1 glycosyltransferase family 2 protein [Ruegeria sp. R13_0]
MRLRRKRRLVRCVKRRRELKPVSTNTAAIRPDDVLLMSVVRNEKIRLPFFLEYYRKLGVNHFLFVDNDSGDGSLEFLRTQPDVSVWQTKTSYKKAGFGLDWSNYLLRNYAHGHWVLTVDPDEFFIYPFCDTRPISALTDWLDSCAVRSFGTMLIDMYPEGPVDDEPYHEGQDPFEITRWFDAGNYMISKNPEYKNLWIQGGPRARVFFQDNPSKAPALNKIPLVKWDRRYVYISSTHSLLPRGLNQVYDEWGGEKTSGALLHAKLINTLGEKAREEMQRNQHYRGSGEYKAYAKQLEEQPVFRCDWSEQYINWRQLEILGLMSKGNWA